MKDNDLNKSNTEYENEQEREQEDISQTKKLLVNDVPERESTNHSFMMKTLSMDLVNLHDLESAKKRRYYQITTEEEYLQKKNLL